VVGWVVVTTAVVLAARGLPWQQTLMTIRQVSAPWIAIAITMNAVPLLLWAAEWRLLLPNGSHVSYSRMFEVVSLTATVLNTIPFFAGEASAVTLLVVRGGLSAGAAAGVLALDQLLVGIGKLAVVSLAAAMAPMPAWLRAGILTLAVAVSSLAVVLAFLAHRAAPSRQNAPDDRNDNRLRRTIVGLGRHLDALRSVDRATRAVGLSLAKKAAELAAIVAIQIAFGMTPSLGTGLLVLAALSLSTLLPVTPANLGVYEASVFAVYRYTGVPADAALAMAIAQHICFLLPSIGVGYITLTVRQLRPASSGQ
jgi:uncharacterized protein (TIRG00374 family)